MIKRTNNLFPLGNETIIPRIELSNHALIMSNNIQNIQNYLYEAEKAKIIKHFDGQNNLATEKSLKIGFVHQRLDNSFALEYINSKNALYYITIFGSVRVALVNNFSIEDFASRIPNFNFSVNDSYLLPSCNYNGKLIIPAVTIDRIQYNASHDIFQTQALSIIAHAARTGSIVNLPEKGFKLPIGINEASNINLMYDLNQNGSHTNSTLLPLLINLGSAAVAAAIANNFLPDDDAGGAPQNQGPDVEQGDQPNHDNADNGNGGPGPAGLDGGQNPDVGDNNQPNNNLGRISAPGGRRVSARLNQQTPGSSGNSPQADEVDKINSELTESYERSWNQYIADNVIPISITAILGFGSICYFSRPSNKITRDAAVQEPLETPNGLPNQRELVTTPHTPLNSPLHSPSNYDSPLEGQLSAIHSPGNSESPQEQVIVGAVNAGKKVAKITFDMLSDTASSILDAMTPAQKPVPQCPATEMKTLRKVNKNLRDIFQSPIKIFDNVKSGLDEFIKNKLIERYDINVPTIKSAIDEFSLKNLSKLKQIFPGGVYEAKAVETILVNIFRSDSILSDASLSKAIKLQTSKNPDETIFGFWYIKYHKSVKNDDPETVAAIFNKIVEKLNLPEDEVLEILTSHNPKAKNFSKSTDNEVLDREICVAYLKYLKIAFLFALTYYQSELLSGAQAMELQGETENLSKDEFDDEIETQDYVESKIKQQAYLPDASTSKQRNNASLAELVVENSPMYIATAANTIAPLAIASVAPDALIKPSLYLYSKINHEIITDNQMSGDGRSWVEFAQNIPAYFTNALKQSSLMELGKYLTDSFIAFGAVENIMSVSNNAALFGISLASNFLRAESNPRYTADSKFSLVTANLAEKHAFYVSSKVFIFAGFAIKTIGGNLLYPFVAENTEKWFDLLSTKTNSLFSAYRVEETGAELIEEDNLEQSYIDENYLTLSNSTYASAADSFDKKIGIVYIPELEIFS